MPRGRAWTQAEVSRLLSLVEGSGNAALLMGSTSRPNQAVWREICQGLAETGYERSVSQCRAKWKALKQAFHSERERRRRAGHHSPRLPPHYRPMESIWKAAGQPVFGVRQMPVLMKLTPRKHRSALATHSSSPPESPEHGVSRDAPALLLPLTPKHEKDEPKRSICGEHIAGVPPTSPTMPNTSCCFPPVSFLDTSCCFSSVPFLGCHTDLKQKRTEGKTAVMACFPGETSLGMERGNQMLPVAVTASGSQGTAAMSEQPAASEDESGASLHGPGVAGLFQNIQQLMVQILQTSRQQQALLESLARDTVSHLQLFSRSLVQMGETLQQLLLQPQIQPGFPGHDITYVPLSEVGPGKPSSPGTPHSSSVCQQETQLYPAADYTSL